MKDKTARWLATCAAIPLLVLFIAPGLSADASGWTFMGFPEKGVWTIELHESHLYAGTTDGVYRLDLNSPSGEWDSLGLDGVNIRTLLILSSDTLLAGTVDGPTTLYRTIDAGQSWHVFDTGFGEGWNPVFGLVKLAGQSDTIFARVVGTSRSDDGGQSWRSVNGFSGGYRLVLDPNDGRTIYDMGENFFFWPVLQRSSDLGDTWESLDTWNGGDNSCHDIAFYPGNSNVAWISMEGLIRKTTNRGQTWSTQMTNNRYCYGVEIDPLRPEHLYVIGAQAGYPLTLYVSHNGGASWETLLESSSPVQPLELKLVSTASGVRLYIGTSLGVYSYFETFEVPCGDVDGDNQPVNISDLVYLVDYMFTGGPTPNMNAANINGQNGLDISDLVWLVDYMFTGGPAPVCDR